MSGDPCPRGRSRQCWSAGALIVLLCIGTADAKSAKTVAIVYKPCSSEVPGHLTVVKNDETKVFTADYTANGVWIGIWNPLDPQSYFDAAADSMSLRVEGGRTECRKSIPVRDDKNDQWVATLTFECNRQAVQEVNIEPMPMVPVSYVRRSPKREGDEGSAPCVEYGRILPGHPSTVHAVWLRREDAALPIEELRLQLGQGDANLEAGGLIVNDLVALAKGTDNVTFLTRDGVVVNLMMQRGKGREHSSPNNASLAIDIDSQKLRDIRLEKVALSVN